MDYNYRDAVKNDVKEYIKNEIELDDWRGKRYELYDYLNETLWTEDSVTGNGSGSYTFNTYKAEEYLCHNLELLGEALREFGNDASKLLSDGAEACDVTIRCYLLGEGIGNAIEEIEQEMGIDLNEEIEEPEIDEN